MLEKKKAEEKRGEDAKSKEEENKLEKLQIGFWNISGIGRKNLLFWEYIKEYDFIGMVETWVEKHDWNAIEKTLPREFKWKLVGATREHKKGRAKGGIITGVKKHLLEEDSDVKSDHAQERTIKVREKRIRILTVYAREERENTWEMIKKNYREAEKSAVIIGGDFNARTGERGASPENDKKRKSKDKKINKMGKEFLEILRGKSWSILNGTTDGDEDGNFTFVSASGSSVIDYAVANSTASKAVKRFAVEKRTESDHMPIKITLELSTEGEWEEEGRDVNEEYEDLIKAIGML